MKTTTTEDAHAPGHALPTLSPEAAAARLRLRTFNVRPHGAQWLVSQDGSERRLRLSADDLSLAARLAQAADRPLSIDELADQLYAATGEPRPGDVPDEPPVSPGPHFVQLDQIRTDGGTQARAGLDETTVTDYADAYADLARQQNGLDQMPALVVFYDGTDYWLADGFHRLAAYRRFKEREPLSAAPNALFARIEQGTRRDAVLYAAGANAAHGLRRTNADKERAVLALLRDQEWGQWSDREIARRCKVSHPFVAALRERTGNVSSERRAADGRTMDVGPIQAANRERAAAINTPDGSPVTDATFWAALSFNHPIAHHWETIAGGKYRSACGITSNHAPRGSREPGHLCSRCAASLSGIDAAPEPDAPAQQHAIPADIQERADRFGLLVAERSDGILLYWPGEHTGDFQGSPPDEVRWLLENEIPRLAVQRAEELGWQLMEATRAGQQLFCCRHPDGGQTAEYGIDLLAYGEALRISGRGPSPVAAPACADCGKQPARMANIGGRAAQRCTACAVLAESEDLQAQLGAQYRGAVERPDLGSGPWHRIHWAGGGGGDYTYTEALDQIVKRSRPVSLHAPLRALSERAEQLGAIIDYTAGREDGRLKLTAPAGYQPGWIWCDADELADLVYSWEFHAQPAAAPAAPAGVDRKEPPQPPDIDGDRIKALLIQMRRYFISHDCPTGECVAWNELKAMFGVGQRDEDDEAWMTQHTGQPFHLRRSSDERKRG